MKRAILFALGLAALVAVAVYAQRSGPEYAAWEYRALLPHETTPARYRQVDSRELALATSEGWELVAVTPHVLLNEERGPEGRKQVATQVYPGYYFKRLRSGAR